jgi:ubiquinone/menaquinone biosynthesis C-methylase UbiE
MQMIKIEKLLNNMQSKRRALALADKLVGFTEHNGKHDFLEIGCGNGLVAKHIAKKYGASVVGIDVDPEQIELAGEDIEGSQNIRFLEADVTDLPFEDDSFDVVLSLGVLHHIDDWLGALGEIKRVLRAKGYFLYADLIYPDWVTRMDSESKMSFGLVTINLEDLNSFLEQSGFNVIHSKLAKRLAFQNYEAVYRRG